MYEKVEIAGTQRRGPARGHRPAGRPRRAVGDLRHRAGAWVLAVALLVAMPTVLWASSLGSTSIVFAQAGAGGMTSPWFDGDYRGRTQTGVYLFEVNPLTGQVGVAKALSSTATFPGFCVDLCQSISTQPQVYELAPLEQAPLTDGGDPGMGEYRAALIRNLWSQHYDPAWATTLPTPPLEGGGAPDAHGFVSSWLRGPTSAWTPEQGAAAEVFGACLWELVHETDANGFDVTAGTLQISDVDATMANAWLAGLDAGGAQAPLYALRNSQYQDYVVYVPDWPVGYPDTHCPEPVTMVGLVAAGACLVAYVRRRERGGAGRGAGQGSLT